MHAEVEKIVRVSLKKALDYDKKGNTGQAYAYYTAVLELCPSKRIELEKRFTTILCEWGLYLEQNNQINDVIKCYQNSLEIFPKNPTMLTNFAAHLLKNEQCLKAIKYLEKALEIDQNFLPAERNLQNACSMAVDRWHFSMLNDRSRNLAFHEAIKKRILLGYDTVLDIGTGTGLLSLYALGAGAKKVFACEYSSVMCDIAKKVFHENQAEDIKLICKASNDLKIPDDIPERVKLVVTEIFDAALFGELVIPTLIDAHTNLLVTDGTGIVIPMSATLYIAAVECEYIRYRSSVLFNNYQCLGSFDLENVLILPDEDYYDTENLQNVNVNYITEPNPILKIDFNDLNDLQGYSRDGVKNVITTTCRYNSIVDGLVTWFKLSLDEEITLNSSQGKSCWQLGVFPNVPKKVTSNDKLTITAEITNERLKCSYLLNNENIIMSDKLIYKLPKDIILFLNDTEYIMSLTQLAKSKKEDFITTVFDTCPFPIYGLTILKKNRNCQTLYYQTNNETLKDFIEQIIHKNKINGKVCFVSDFSEISCTLDNILVHNFDIKGELIDWGQQSYCEIYSSLLNPAGTLLPERIFLMGQLVYSEELPKIVSVKDDNFQKLLNVKSSNYRKSYDSSYSDTDDNDEEDNDKCNFMEKTEYKNSKQCKYVIAKYINKYKINQVFDLNSSLYTYTAVSDTKTLAEMDNSEFKEEIINFGKISSEKGKFPNTLIFWYKIFLTNNIVHETRRINSFTNHAAILFESELKDKVIQGEDINIKIQQMHDLVRLSIA